MRRLYQLLVACLLVCVAGISPPASAQLQANLPHESTVARSESLGIDGDWKIREIGKRIRIDGGVGYALDTWMHAVLWVIKPGMVVMQNIEQTTAGQYEADDLPLQGRSRMTVQQDGTIRVSVAGAFGPVNLVLEPVGEAVATTISPQPGRAHTDRRASTDQFDTAQVPIAQRRPLQPDLPAFRTWESFTGCDGDDEAMPDTGSPRERMESANRTDKITQRRFASFSLDDVEAGRVGEDMGGLCWFRLDGVWRELGNITLDRSKDRPKIWGSDSPELIVLANGNYTTPKFLFIGSVGNDDEELYVAEGFSDAGFARFTSSNGLTLQETLKRGGPVKRYTSNERFKFGRSLSVDVTRSGRVRLNLGDTTYVRPSPGVSKTTMSNQIAANDAFLLGYNLENLSASRRGYDAVQQDPFFLLENPKFDVFAEAGPQAYFISEKRTIPLGLTLIQEATQGMVFSKSAVSSGTELQGTLAVTLGGNMKGNGYAMGVPVETSASYEATVSAMTSWESNKTVAQTIGFSRAKQYALVVDHPYVTLSDDFVDAVEDARRYGNFDGIIDKFGTHYPYAVTYGAAAKVTHSFTEESWKKAAEVNVGYKASAGAETLGTGGSSHYGVNAGLRTGSSGSVGEEGATFVAVGGNGSWNENGYSAGSTPYPILADLRPIHELLNPLNFPGEPEIYQGVREDLRLHTERYISKYANQISDRSLLPLVEAKRDEPLETWRIYVRQIWCTDGKIGMVSDVEGTLSMDGFIGGNRERYTTTKDKKLKVACKKKAQKKTHSYESGSAGMLEITGTRAQIAAYTIALEMNWHYLPFGKKSSKNNKKNFKRPDALKNGLVAGKSKDYRWTVGKKGNPDFTLLVRMKRIK